MKKQFFIFFAWLQIFLQVLIPFVSAIPYSARAQDVSNTAQSPFAVDRETPPDSSLPYSDTMQTVASSLSSSGADGITTSAKSAATGYASSSAEKWLSQFGTAQVHLNVDDNGNWDDSSFDFLAPLYDNKKTVLFTQLGMRAPDGRFTGNLGFGVRTFNSSNWMLGVNSFIDDDFTGGNRRAGFGGEAWTDNLKLSANGYVGITDWHSSRDFDDYDEKPADGFDVRAEGYLPAYPQLGAKVMYEQYYGDNVALFDTDHLQKDPSAVTVGLNYTPVPLVTAGIDYKRGQDSMDDTQFSLSFHYVLGQSLQSQMSTDQVAYRRSLAGSRYDLVERNNEIVLQYKKKEVAGVLANMVLNSLKDYSTADGVTSNSVVLHATTSDGQPAKNASITWSVSGSAKLSTSSAVTDNNGNATVNVTDNTAEQVTVSAVSGDITASTPSNFINYVASLNLKVTKNGSKANGTDADSGQVTVVDSNGKAVAGEKISWSVNNSAKIIRSDSETDASGHATVEYTDTKAETVKLTASAAGKTDSVNSNFVADTTGNNITVKMTTDNSPADGSTINVADATVTDSNGKPVSGVTVNWTVTGSAKLSASSSVTDSTGNATVNLTDSISESGLTVTASAGDAKGSTSTTFKGIQTNLTVTTANNDAPADGVSTNTVNALVTDSAGKALPNVTVNWATSGSAKLAGTSSVTDSAGNAKMNLTDTVAESNITITATTSDAKGTTQVSFTEIQQNVTVTMKVNNSDADGKTQNIAQVVVLKNNKPVAGAQVSWSKDSSNAKNASSPTATTDSNGVATMAYTDTTAETFNVVATVGDYTGKTQSTFVAPDFGPINLYMPELTASYVNYDIAVGGTPVVIRAYNGMAVGDKIAVNSHVSYNWDGRTLDYSAPVHTVTTSEVGQDISVTLPESDLMGATGDSASSNPTAYLNVDATVTQGEQTKSASLKYAIDTCPPGVGASAGCPTI